MKCTGIRRVSVNKAVVVAFAVLGASSAYAQTAWTWNTATGNFNTPGNWTPTSVPASLNTTSLTFGGGGYTSTNDLGTFVLNQLTSTATGAVSIAGGTLSFQGTSPSILQNGTGALTISSAVSLGAVTTVAGTGSATVNLTGPISGASGAIYNKYGGSLRLSGGASTTYLSAVAGTTTLTGTAAFAFSGTGNQATGAAAPVANVAVSTGFVAGSSKLVLDGATVNLPNNANVMVAQATGSTSTFQMVNGAKLTNSDEATDGGRFGTGLGNATISIESGSKVATRLIELGRVDGGTSATTVTGTGSSIVGGQLVIGRENDTGTTTTASLTVANNASVTVSPFSTTTAAAGLAFWGNANTTGTLNVLSGGQVTLNAEVQLALSGSAQVGIGESLAGTANLNVSGAGSVFSANKVVDGTDTVVGAADGVIFASELFGQVTNISVSQSGTMHAFDLQHSFDGDQSGDLNVSITTGGTLSLDRGLFLGIGDGAGDSGTATLTVDHGTVSMVPGVDATETDFQVIGSANANISINNSSTFTQSGTDGNTIFGFETGGTTNLTVGGASSFTAGGLMIMSLADGSVSHATVSGGSTMTIGTTGLDVGELDLADGGAGCVATLSVTGTGSTLNVIGVTFIAGTPGGTASLTVDNGATFNGEDVLISQSGGLEGGSGTLAVKNGSSAILTGTLVIGTDATVVATGGSVIRAQAVIPGSLTPVANIKVDASSIVIADIVSVTDGQIIKISQPTSPAGQVSPVSLYVGTIDVGGGGTSTPTGLLDLTNTGAVDVFDGLDAVTLEIAAYFHGGKTVGIGSSIAGTVTSDPRDALATLGVIVNSDGRGGSLFSTFDGIALDATDVIIKYTYVGDTNLDGVVDGQDLQNLLAGENGHLTGWINGDLNYDGVVDGVDLALLLNSLTHQGASFGGPLSGGTSGAVPEPTALAPLAAAAMFAGRRRRR